MNFKIRYHLVSVFWLILNCLPPWFETLDFICEVASMHTWSHDGESFEQVLLMAEMNPSLDTAAHAAWTIASAYPLIPFFTPKEKSNEIYVSFFCLEVVKVMALRSRRAWPTWWKYYSENILNISQVLFSTLINI